MENKYNRNDIEDIVISYSFLGQHVEDGCMIVVFKHKDGSSLCARCSYERADCFTINKLINENYR